MASPLAAQIPDTLQLIAGSLATGYSLPQAIDAAGRDAPPPVSTEFDRALVVWRCWDGGCQAADRSNRPTLRLTHAAPGALSAQTDGARHLGLGSRASITSTQS